MRILIVEDDALLGDGIQVGLQQQGFVVDWTRNASASELAITTESYAAIVLDWNLPKLSGLDLRHGGARRNCVGRSFHRTLQRDRVRSRARRRRIGAHRAGGIVVRDDVGGTRTAPRARSRARMRSKADAA